MVSDIDFNDMKKTFIYIAILALSSCTIKDYEQDGNSFNDYMRGVAWRYGLGTEDALKCMKTADEKLYGGGDASNYKKIGVNKWEVGYRDTLSTNGISFTQPGARWSLTRDLTYSANQGIYSFERTETGWEGSFKEVLNTESNWGGIISKFSCTMDIKVVAGSDEVIIADGYIFHIDGKRTEDSYSSKFRTTEDGMHNGQGSFLIETFRNGQLLHSDTVSINTSAESY